MYKEDHNLGSFFTFLYVEKGLSKNTIEAYSNDLNNFLSWLNKLDIQDYKNISEVLINEYVAYLFKNGLKSSSVNRKISSLKSFYLFLIKKKVISSSPLSEIITPKKRGCQLSVLVNKSGKEVYKTLNENGVVVDWREPNVIRFAPVPLYNSFEDIYNFSLILKKCI